MLEGLRSSRASLAVVTFHGGNYLFLSTPKSSPCALFLGKHIFTASKQNYIKILSIKKMTTTFFKRPKLTRAGMQKKSFHLIEFVLPPVQPRITGAAVSPGYGNCLGVKSVLSLWYPVQQGAAHNQH